MTDTPPLCVVTGANAGIGKAAALQLAARNATVVLACRNLARGSKARDEIIEETGNQRVELMELDTSSLASVRSFTASLQEKFNTWDVLINNAGNFDLAVKKPAMTSEGLENIL